MRARARSGSSSPAPSPSFAWSSSSIVLQRRVGHSLAREEDQPDADADGRLDRLQADPERDAAAVGDAVVHERRRDRDLDEADVAGPEREDRRDVDQHEHEPGGGERLVDVERVHRRPHREQLAQPARELEGGRATRRAAERASPRGPRGPASPSAAACRALRAHRGAGSARSPTRRGTAARRRASTIAIAVTAQPGIFAASSTQITSVTAGNRSNIRCANTEPISVAVVPLRVPRQPPPQHGDPRQLADAARQHGVREQADRERREDRAGSADAASGSTA